MIYTTLNAIKEHDPCVEGWRTLLNSLSKTQADDEPLSMLRILESNGIADALWCVRAVPEHDKSWRLLAVKYARRVQHLMADPRSIAAIDTAERFGKGEASEEELSAAAAAAHAATGGAAHAAHAAADAAYATVSAVSAYAAVFSVSAYAADAVYYAAAYATAYAAERDAQTVEFKRLIMELGQ